MATVAQPLSPVSRQPFGVIGGSRLRALDSMKNHQNGMSLLQILSHPVCVRGGDKSSILMCLQDMQLLL